MNTQYLTPSEAQLYNDLNTLIVILEKEHSVEELLSVPISHSVSLVSKTLTLQICVRFRDIIIFRQKLGEFKARVSEQERVMLSRSIPKFERDYKECDTLLGEIMDANSSGCVRGSVIAVMRAGARFAFFAQCDNLPYLINSMEENGKQPGFNSIQQTAADIKCKILQHFIKLFNISANALMAYTDANDDDKRRLSHLLGKCKETTSELNAIRAELDEAARYADIDAYAKKVEECEAKYESTMANAKIVEEDIMYS